jgi:hypothetical protein
MIEVVVENQVDKIKKSIFTAKCLHYTRFNGKCIIDYSIYQILFYAFLNLQV